MTRADCPAPVMPRPDRVVSLDTASDVVPTSIDADARRLATALGFLHGGNVMSEAEKVIHEHLDSVREAERRIVTSYFNATML